MPRVELVVIFRYVNGTACPGDNLYSTADLAFWESTNMNSILRVLLGERLVRTRVRREASEIVRPTGVETLEPRVLLSSDPSIVGHWSFDETSGNAAQDSSGLAHHGTVVGAQFRPDEGARLGSLFFDGNDYVTLPEPQLGLKSDNGAVGAWIKMNGQPITIPRMVFYGSTQTAGDGFGSHKELHLHVNTDGSAGFFIEGGNTDVALGGGSLNDGHWHYLYATWDKTVNRVELSVDGQLVDSAEHSGLTFGLARVRLGKPTNATNHFRGWMDEVTLYDQAVDGGVVNDNVGLTGKIAHWPLDADADDISGLDHHGAVQGNPVWQTSEGVLQLDGDDRISTANSAVLNLTVTKKRSVSLWFNADTLPTTPGDYRVLYEEGGAQRGLNIYLHEGRLWVGAWNDNASESNWSGTFLSTDAITAGNWHHVAVTLDAGATLGSGQIIGYLDGEQFGSGAASQLWPRNDVGIGDRHVGTRFNDSGFPVGDASGGFGFIGQLDDVRVYNRALSQAEIQGLTSQEVSMADTKASAWEDGPDGPAVITFTRSGSTDQNLVVNLDFGGTATHGTDYTTTRLAAAFAPGESQATVAIEPIDDVLVETDESVVVTILPPIAGQRPYTWNSPDTVTVTILDDESADRDSDGLDGRTEHIVGTDQDNADSDNDGVSDADELDQGSDPLNPDDEGQPPAAGPSTYDFTIQTNADGSKDVGRFTLSVESGEDPTLHPPFVTHKLQEEAQTRTYHLKPGVTYKIEYQPVEAYDPPDDAVSLSGTFEHPSNVLVERLGDAEGPPGFNNTVQRWLIGTVDIGIDYNEDGNSDVPEETFDPPNEIDAGGLVRLNDNDDNRNFQPDHQDTGIDGDLVALPLKLDGLEAIEEGTVSLRVTSGGQHIRLWGSKDRSGTPIHDGTSNTTEATWDIETDTLPTVVFVEGVALNTTAADIGVEWAVATAKGGVASDAVRLTVTKVDVVAFRPQHSNSILPADFYAPLRRTAVHERDEESARLGPGIRVNRDSQGQPEMRHLIEVELKFAHPQLPHVNYYLRRGNSNIEVYFAREIKDEHKFTFHGDSSDPLTIPTNESQMTVWVSWPTTAKGTASLTLEARLAHDIGPRIYDNVLFHRFESMIMAVGGRGSDPFQGYTSGMFTLADMLYESGYDAFKAHENTVASPDGVGPARDEMVMAYASRDVSGAAIVGHSRGGGSTHDLANGLNNLGYGNLTKYTAYVDAVRNEGFLAQTSLPPGTQYHVNLYQPNFGFGGDAMPAADIDLNVNTTSWGANLDHTTIDDDWNVIMILMEGNDVAGHFYQAGEGITDRLETP